MYTPALITAMFFIHDRVINKLDQDLVQGCETNSKFCDIIMEIIRACRTEKEKDIDFMKSSSDNYKVYKCLLVLVTITTTLVLVLFYYCNPYFIIKFLI